MTILSEAEDVMKKKKVSAKAKKPDVKHKTGSVPPLEVCRNAPHAEMARTENKDDPCDDGREG